MTWTIGHDHISLTALDAPFVFKTLHGVSCSVCAPDTMSEAQVVAFANAERPKRRWRAADKSTFGLGLATPSPCSQVAGRLHWFLISGKSWEPQ
jgi:hypothetical protein